MTNEEIEVALKQDKVVVDRKRTRNTLSYLNWIYAASKIEQANASQKNTPDFYRWLTEHLVEIRTKIKPTDRFSRGKRYNEFSDAHNDIKTNPQAGTKSFEKNIAKLMRKAARDEHRIFQNIGEILNFEIPLSANDYDTRGDIDLVAYDCPGGNPTMYLLELKKPQSTESLLRCMLEIYTYFLTIKQIPKFIKDFGLPSNTRIILAPAVFKGSTPHTDWEALSQKQFFKDFVCEMNKNLSEVRIGTSIELRCFESTTETMQDIIANAQKGSRMKASKKHS